MKLGLSFLAVLTFSAITHNGGEASVRNESLKILEAHSPRLAMSRLLVYIIFLRFLFNHTKMFKLEVFG